MHSFDQGKYQIQTNATIKSIKSRLRSKTIVPNALTIHPSLRMQIEAIITQSWTVFESQVASRFCNLNVSIWFDSRLGLITNTELCIWTSESFFFWYNFVAHKFSSSSCLFLLYKGRKLIFVHQTPKKAVTQRD